MTNTLYDALLAPHADNSATFLTLDDGRQVSFAEFVALAARIATALGALGAVPGDRIVVQAPKCLETLALYAASLRAGLVYLPLNPAYTVQEVDYFMTDAAPRMLVCDVADAAALGALAARTEAHLLTLGADGSGTLAAAIRDATGTLPVAARAPDDLAALLYTSGTTGRSKGAMLTQTNLLSNARVLTELWRITEQDRLIHALPIFHTHGLFVAVNTALLAGAGLRFMEKFDAGGILDALPRATMLMGVPTFYTRLLADPRLTRARTAPMRLFISGSAPLLAETHCAFAERTGHHILERYGMTETSMITSNPYDGARRAGTVGLPLPGCEVIVTDPATGAVLPQGAVGMVEVRGANVFKGYWNMPEKTAEELRDTGFFITGDLGAFDAEGYLSIVGRQKDLIISGGLNIYPKEIEDVLNDLPDVAESAVFGVPHPDFGEAIVAHVVPVAGGTVDRARLGQAVAERLARFKHPREIVYVDSLPRNAMGKVQKNTLRAGHAPST